MFVAPAQPPDVRPYSTSNLFDTARAPSPSMNHRTSALYSGSRGLAKFFATQLSTKRSFTKPSSSVHCDVHRIHHVRGKEILRGSFDPPVLPEPERVTHRPP